MSCGCGLGKAPKVSKCDVKRSLERRGIDFSEDFHALRSAQVMAVISAARSVGYRQPKNANGSYGRYAFSHLKKACKR